MVQTLRATGAAQLYAGAMSPPAAEQIISALQLLANVDGSGRGPRKLSQLRENSNYFREKLQDIGLNVLGDRDSPVMVRTPSADPTSQPNGTNLQFVADAPRQLSCVEVPCPTEAGSVKLGSRGAVQVSIMACCCYAAFPP